MARCVSVCVCVSAIFRPICIRCILKFMWRLGGALWSAYSSHVAPAPAPLSMPMPVTSKMRTDGVKCVRCIEYILKMERVDKTHTDRKHYNILVCAPPYSYPFKVNQSIQSFVCSGIDDDSENGWWNFFGGCDVDGTARIILFLWAKCVCVCMCVWEWATHRWTRRCRIRTERTIVFRWKWCSWHNVW